MAAMIPVQAKPRSGGEFPPPTCLIHPTSPVRYVPWTWRTRSTSRWSCLGCEGAARAPRAKLGPRLHRTRPVRFDPGVLAPLLGRVLAMAHASAVALGDLEPFEEVRAFLTGCVAPDDPRVEAAEDAAFLAVGAVTSRAPMVETVLWVIDRARAEARTRATWNAVAVEMRLAAPAREAFPWPLPEEEVAVLQAVYLAYRADEEERDPRVLRGLPPELRKPRVFLSRRWHREHDAAGRYVSRRFFA